MPKVVINSCFGGFGLSVAAVRRLAQLQGRKCFFFTHIHSGDERYQPITMKEGRSSFWSAFDIPNPNEVLRYKRPWANMSDEERVEANALYDKHIIESRPENRADPLLVQVVEELGEAASGAFSRLKVVEVPDNIKWHIEDYDGREHVAQDHETWS